MHELFGWADVWGQGQWKEGVWGITAISRALPGWSVGVPWNLHIFKIQAGCSGHCRDLKASTGCCAHVTPEVHACRLGAAECSGAELTLTCGVGAPMGCACCSGASA